MKKEEEPSNNINKDIIEHANQNLGDGDSWDNSEHSNQRYTVVGSREESEMAFTVTFLLFLAPEEGGWAIL